MIRNAVVGLLVLGSVAACSVVTASFSARLGANPTTSGGSFNTGGGMTVAADLQEYEGRTAVCGVWAQSERQSVLSKGGARRVLPTGSVYLDGKAIVRGLTFMREVAPTGNYVGAEAGCVASDRPWQAGDENRRITIRLPRQVIYRDDQDSSGGITVYFYQKGPRAEKNGLSASGLVQDILKK